MTPKPYLLALGGLVVAGLAVAGVARTRSSNGSSKEALAALPELRVPEAKGEVHVDGELDEAAWKTAARTGAFVDGAEREASPFSDARLVWKDGELFLGLYAADQDIRSAAVGHDGPVWRRDSFHVSLSVGDGKDYGIDVGPTCIVADGVRTHGGAMSYAWESGARRACDEDGTVDQEGDMDEEWVVEMALPLRSIGVKPTPGQRVEVRIRRCDGELDTPSRRCSDARPFVAVLEPPPS